MVKAFLGCYATVDHIWSFMVGQRLWQWLNVWVVARDQSSCDVTPKMLKRPRSSIGTAPWHPWPAYWAVETVHSLDRLVVEHPKDMGSWINYQPSISMGDTGININNNREKYEQTSWGFLGMPFWWWTGYPQRTVSWWAPINSRHLWCLENVNFWVVLSAPPGLSSIYEPC